MRRDFRVARACGVEAARDFQWHEYAPFAWILGAQLLFLLLALNLGTTISMGTAGAAVKLFAGDAPLHYPTFFLYLPNAASWWELILYTVAGAYLIPLSIARVQTPMDPDLQGPGFKARVNRAWPPTLIAGLLTFALLSGWQWLFKVALVPLIRASFPGLQATAAIWGLSLVVSYSLSALFIYVPILALQPGSSLVKALREGIREGVRLFKWTVLYLFVFALPALPFLMAVQLGTAFLATRMRPEMIAVVLAIYAILISVATYLTYAAAARLHWASQVEEA
ncbi:MAG TPA: hypothetical protein VFR25_07475 [Candidatus Eisenbacteria bacterium]|nr:hypothetical protein [Candidatus Eisenbacteria bacterium]